MRAIHETTAQWPARLLALALVVPGCGAPPDHPVMPPQSSAPAALRYEVGAAPDLSTLNVQVCFDGRPPERLVAGLSEARDFVGRATAAGGRPIPIGPEGIDLADLGPDDCVRYDVDAELAASRSRFSSRDAQGLLLDPRAWLWHAPVPEELPSTIRFRLPQSMGVAVPWPKQTDGSYRVPATTFRQSGTSAFGSIWTMRLDVPRPVVEVSVLGSVEEIGVGRETIHAWIEEAVMAVSTVLGHFPVPRVALMVVSVSGVGEPVAFGLVRRGGGPSVLLLLRRGAPADELVGEWVAVHELSHLLLPQVRRSDAWLGEGLATYYQEVARARRGLQTPERSWENLIAGFGRGRAGGTGRPLGEESAAMYRTFEFRRVYWAGTAFFLEADVQLRERSDGRLTLDMAIEGARARLQRPGGTVTAAEVIAELDRATDSRVFSELAARYLSSSEFPEVDPIFDRLGVTRDDGRIALSTVAPLAEVRDAIMRGRTQENQLVGPTSRNP